MGMTTAYDRLWRVVRNVRQRPARDLAAAVQAGLDDGQLPSPWVIWTLIGLVRHRRRQFWVAQVVTERLGGHLPALATGGALAHPAHIEQSGLVPGMTDWEYDFHGRGCRLTHRGTGRVIDVDFFGPTAEYFDLYFYVQYLRSLRDPEPPEARLVALHPSFDPIRLAIGSLREAGILTPLEGREAHVFRLAGSVLDHEDDIDAFCALWADEGRRPWLAALIGDWPLVHEAAQITGDSDLIERTASRAEATRDTRCRELLALWHDEAQRSDVLMALDDLNARVLVEQLRAALEGPIGGTTSRALKIIERRDDPTSCPAIHALFGRLDPTRELPEPYLWVACQRFLLCHGYHVSEMLAALAQADGVAIAEAALLAMEYDPGQALPLFRRALRSRIPINRSMSAAVLALIDHPWSRRELLAILDESHDQAATSECRAALRECHNAEAHEAVRRWEEANPHEPEPGRWIKVSEMMLRNAGSWIRHEMQRRHERVMAVRDRVPVESAAAAEGATS